MAMNNKRTRIFTRLFKLGGKEGLLFIFSYTPSLHKGSQDIQCTSIRREGECLHFAASA